MKQSKDQSHHIGVNTWSKGRKLSDEHRRKISLATKGEGNPMWGREAWNKGKPRSPETKRKISLAKIGKGISEAHKKAVGDAQRGRKASIETRKKMSAIRTGRGSGLTSKNILARSTVVYLDWRISVYKRDGFICQKCLWASGGILEAHHIYSFSDYEEIRYDVNNGITFCSICHHAFHRKYGKSKNTGNQLMEFMGFAGTAPTPGGMEKLGIFKSGVKIL